MTEAEWLEATGTIAMLAFLKRKASERKLRLFQVACCRRIWHLVPDTRWRDAVQVAEQYADGEVSDKRRKAVLAMIPRPMGRDGQMERMAVFAADVANRRMHKNRVALGCAAVIGFAARVTMGIVDTGPCRLDSLPEYQHERAVEASLLRDIFGNPFRSVAFDPAWRTDTALSLARQMYAARDFSATPILADALQDAGCNEDAVLSHCRSDDVHVRGCWVVDLVLGKE
jgi:hypothetical protein